MRKLIIGALAAVGAVWGDAASAAAPAVPTPALSPQDQATVQRVVAYLESVTTADGRFTQIDPRGGQAGGAFYLQRPGKARLDYDPPSGLTVASDGRVLTAVDRRLKTIQRVPLGFTPFALFLARNIRLDKDVTVSGVSRTAQGLSLTARRGRKASQGQITLNFSEGPLALKGWSITEPQGGTTTVTLSHFAPAAGHASAFFQPTLPTAPAPAQPDDQ